jgi:hypothetical protein
MMQAWGPFAHVTFSAMHYDEEDRTTYHHPWEQLIRDDGDLAGKIAHILAWHREDVALKGDTCTVVCLGWVPAPKPERPVPAPVYARGEQLRLWP